jgi:hypothetical protein
LDAFELEGVVVTALGIKREKKLGYATQQIGGDEVSDVKKFCKLNSSGKIAGLDIKTSGNCGSTQVVIRGNNLIG